MKKEELLKRHWPIECFFEFKLNVELLNFLHTIWYLNFLIVLGFPWSTIHYSDSFMNNLSNRAYFNIAIIFCQLFLCLNLELSSDKKRGHNYIFFNLSFTIENIIISSRLSLEGYHETWLLWNVSDFVLVQMKSLTFSL